MGSVIDDVRGEEDAQPEDDSPSSVNAEYACTASGHDVLIYSLSNETGGQGQLSSVRVNKHGYHRRLVLSQDFRHVLAVSNGSRLQIFDIRTGKVTHNLSVPGRAITGLTWVHSESLALVAGMLDGSVVVWNLSQSLQPRFKLTTNEGVCHAVSICPSETRLLASIHSKTLLVWNLQGSAKRPVSQISEDKGFLAGLAWSPQRDRKLLATASSQAIELYDFTQHHSAAEASKPDDDTDSEATQVSRPDPACKVALDKPLKYLCWISAFILLGLSEDGLCAHVYILNNDGNKLSSLWSCTLQSSASAVHIKACDARFKLFAISASGMESHEIPVAINDEIGRAEVSQSVEPTPGQTRPSKEDFYRDISSTASKSEQTQSRSTMQPTPISGYRAAFAKTSRQLQHRRSSFHKSRRQVSRAQETTARSARGSEQTPATSLTAGLEFPRGQDDEGSSSPMPFLSPSIPSRGVSPNDLPSLNDSIAELPPLPRPSFSSSIQLTAINTTLGHDSDDSDDETFADVMHGSGMFLPGGINVPLPKACGALFAPSGQLLTFFPPKPKPASARRETFTEQPRERGAKANRATKLFPTFGNLAWDFNANDDSGENDSTYGSDDPDHFDLNPRITFEPASFPAQLSRNSQGSFAKPETSEQHSQHKIVVSIHELADVQELHPAQQGIAEEYRILCHDHESGARLCEHNASVASKFGLRDVAEVWQLIASLLEDLVPLEALSLGSAANEVLVVARNVKLLARSNLGIGFDKQTKHNGQVGKLRWASHPLGGAWLIRRVLEWAEQRADTQLLACISAVLVSAERNNHGDQTHMRHTMLTQLPTFSREYFPDAIGLDLSPLAARSIPVLRNDQAATIPSLQKFPVKLQPGSNASSRLPSQPPTPYLHSSSSTPPFNPPSVGRQTPRVSASGFASPEFHRSSFSAAAKYYAQSITDKFSSYGTSPPIKKTGTSPSTSAELSSSLPTGSWLAKSVSFASTPAANGTRASQLSSSYEQEAMDEDYDSDKTIEDGSAPQTPNSATGAISVTLKNQSEFGDEMSGGTRASLLPEQLVATARVWIQYYAEQLRSWNLVSKAAEFEKVAGLSLSYIATLAVDVSGTNSIRLHPTRPLSRTRTCAICLTTSKGIQQTCTSCTHSSHEACLEAYCQELSDVEFSCPSGCGCWCARLPFVVEEPHQTSPQTKPTFKRKASFTDPRRWRARVEGDSW